jgi:hypothetical protein
MGRVSITYDVHTRTGQVDLRYAGDGVDMPATLRLFKNIDPEVKVIHICSAGRPDTRYRLIDGEWAAFRLVSDPG